MNRLHRNSETYRTARKLARFLAVHALALWHILSDEAEKADRRAAEAVYRLLVWSVPVLTFLLLIYLLRLHLPCS